MTTLASTWLPEFQGRVDMKKFSKRSALLFAGAIAACALVLPSVASAASWGPIGSHHTLDSFNLSFTSTTAIGASTGSCTRSSLTTAVANAQNLEITAATFGGLCTFRGTEAGTCTMTMVGTRFPWTATAVTTSNLQIHGFQANVRIENLRGLGACLFGSCRCVTHSHWHSGRWQLDWQRGPRV